MFSKQPPRRLRKADSRLSRPVYERLESRQALAAFAGTPADDVVTITFVAGAPAQIEINGVVSANPDPTLQLDLGTGAGDLLNLRGSTFDIVGLSVAVGDINNDGFDGEGTVNGGAVVFTFGGQLCLSTDTGNDSFTIAAAAGLESPGLETPFQSFSLDGGEGSDSFQTSGGLGYIRGGAGNDLIHSVDGHAVGEIDGGANYDRWQSDAATANWSVAAISGGFSLVDSGPGGGTMEGVEKLIGLSPVGNPGTLNRLSRDGLVGATTLGLYFSIFDNIAVVSQPSSGTSLELENFNSFGGGTGPGGIVFEPAVNVKATDYDIEATELNKLVIGGNVNAGDTSLIEHAIRPANIKHLIVTNSGGLDSRSAFLSQAGTTTRFVVSGLTTVPIGGIDVINLPNATVVLPEITLIGSKTASTRFYVSASLGRVTLTGGLVADTIVVGHPTGSVSRDLDRMKGFINIQGGGGNDYLRIDDRDATGRFSYRLRDNWIFNSPDPAGDPVRQFAGIWHSGLARVELRATAQENRIRLTPSFVTRYAIYAGSPTEAPGDRFFLVGSVPQQRVFISQGPRTGTWFFGVNGNDDGFAKSVFIDDVETNVGLG